MYQSCSGKEAAKGLRPPQFYFEGPAKRTDLSFSDAIATPFGRLHKVKIDGIGSVWIKHIQSKGLLREWIVHGMSWEQCVFM